MKANCVRAYVRACALVRGWMPCVRPISVPLACALSLCLSCVPSLCASLPSLPLSRLCLARALPRPHANVCVCVCVCVREGARARERREPRCADQGALMQGPRVCPISVPLSPLSHSLSFVSRSPGSPDASPPIIPASIYWPPRGGRSRCACTRGWSGSCEEWGRGGRAGFGANNSSIFTCIYRERKTVLEK